MVPVRTERVRETEPGDELVGVDERGGFRTGDVVGDGPSVDDILPTPAAAGFLVAADMPGKISLRGRLGDFRVRRSGSQRWQRYVVGERTTDKYCSCERGGLRLAESWIVEEHK